MPLKQGRDKITAWTEIPILMQEKQLRELIVGPKVLRICQIGIPFAPSDVRYG